MKYDMIIIGAGVSGLCAAYTVAANRPHLHILVLEKESVCGRKLSASGNGKCNVTNSAFQSSCYHSSNPEFIEQWVSAHNASEVTDFLYTMGIPTYSRNGYYYPVSNQAKQVTNHIYQRCLDMGIDFLFQTEVISIQKNSHSPKTTYDITDSGHNIYHSSIVFLATGGAAASKLGGSRSGYQLAKMLSHTIVPVHAVLSPIYMNDPDLRYAKGVRIDGTVTLQQNKEQSWRESGQIQFNETNVSGIVIMNLSCHLPYFTEAECHNALHIDCLPAWSWNELHDYLLQQTCSAPQESIRSLLQGIFPNGFVTYLLKRLRIQEHVHVSDITEKQWNRIVSNCKKMMFTPILKEDFDKAQVTAGGVAVDEIDINTFESRKQKGVYIAGELLDINGICGGYNLTFAILSGIQAAGSIVEKKTVGGSYD